MGGAALKVKRYLWLIPLIGLLASCGTEWQGARVAPSPARVFSHSLNRSDVEVYLLCGDREASLLGVVSRLGAASFEIPSERRRCVRGLNFFLVVLDQGYGYWVGPFQWRAGAQLDLVIERYAGLSVARLH